MQLDFIDKMRSALVSGRRFALATIVNTVGPSPQKAGARMIVFENGDIYGTVGGGAIENRIIADAVVAIADGRPLFKSYNLEADAGMICGGDMSAFIEPVGVSEQVVVFGCGHVSRALAPVLVNLGFGVTVVDDRAEWADSKAFPPEVSVVCRELDPFLDGLDDNIEKLFILSLTRGHKFDYHVLRHFIGLKRRYLGVMASKKKAAEFEKALIEEGYDEALLKDVFMPVGVSIGSSSPEEIAISIAAQLVSVRARH